VSSAEFYREEVLSKLIKRIDTGSLWQAQCYFLLLCARGVTEPQGRRGSVPRTSSDRARLLNELLEQRRVDLGLKWSDVAARTGMSNEAVRATRAGRAAPLTEGMVERALGLTGGAIRAVKNGTADTLALPAPPIPPGTPPEVAAHWHDESVRTLWGLQHTPHQVRLDMVEIYLAALRASSGEDPPEVSHSASG
jgi:hypothetical protein